VCAFAFACPLRSLLLMTQNETKVKELQEDFQRSLLKILCLDFGFLLYVAFINSFLGAKRH